MEKVGWISSKRKSRFAALLAGLGLVFASVLVSALPANAAVGCSSLSYNQSSGQVTASCSGNHSGAVATIVVKCNAVWPYSPWTNTHNTTVNYGLSFVYTISNCPAPASYSISGTVS